VRPKFEQASGLLGPAYELEKQQGLEPSVKYLDDYSQCSGAVVAAACRFVSRGH